MSLVCLSWRFSGGEAWLLGGGEDEEEEEEEGGEDIEGIGNDIGVGYERGAAIG